MGWDDFIRYLQVLHWTPQTEFQAKLMRLSKMRLATLSIDPNGEWSPRQATAVLKIINPEAKAHGLYFEQLNVTTTGGPYRRVRLLAHCMKHGCLVPLNEACRKCLAE